MTTYDPGDWAIVAPTFADGRDTCVEGQSGLLAALGGYPGPLVEKWNRSFGELELVTGARCYIDGADDGALRIQGKNLRGAWCDEVGLWRRTNWKLAWTESLGFAVRHEPARIVATGTPKAGHPLVKLLLEDERAVVTNMRMLDNAANLHPDTVAEFLRRFDGTRLGRQELEGEFVEEAVGALWTLDMIASVRFTPADLANHLVHGGLTRVVVAVDPSGSEDEDTGASECGIVVAGTAASTKHAYVLDDKSLRASPNQWAKAAVNAYYEHKADRLVAERNFGGEMVRAVIQTVDRNVPVKLVNASRGKAIRAEPVSSLYERELVHHVGVFRDLEDQMCDWVPDSGMDSPDRMDALVWALTDLMLDAGGGKQYASYDRETEPVARRGDLVLRGEQYLDKP